ncbi:MAG: WecB/TagA/CpsF family glycosyltransferase, partial [Cyanobacteria bacterium P01_D01_bin.56]
MVYSTRSAAIALRKTPKQLKKQSVIGFPVTSEPFETQVDTILDWAQQRLSKIVCVANVHMLIEAKFHIGFASILHRADMLTPDGMPLAWVVSWMNKRRQDRVAGMDIFMSLCRKASKANVSLFFLGSTPDVLEKMQERLHKEYPDLPIAGIEDLPFRPLSYAEDMELVNRINQSGAGIVLLSLGCPKQERWINAHKNKINAVMIGVGGVFP